MPEATVTFRVHAPPAALVARLADPKFVAEGIPQVVRVDPVSETEARWLVQLKIGPISRQSTYVGTLVERSDRRVRFRAVGAEAVIEGQLDLAPVAVGETEATLRLSMNGQGPLRSVIDAYLGKRVSEDARTFAERLEARLRPTST